MISFSEIEDPVEIKKLQKVLSRKIESQASTVRKRWIGFPSNQFEATVHFMKPNGDVSTWWRSSSSENGDSWANYIGRGNPYDKSSLLMIDLQFNMVRNSFHRRLGGAFVREDETMEVFLAHRGIVTRGKSRVPWDRLVRQTTESPIQVNTSSGPGSMFLVSALESPDLIGEISRFATEIRTALNREPAAIKTRTSAQSKSKGAEVELFDITLREFMEEFSGTRRTSKKKSIRAIVRHGTVARYLNELLEQHAKPLSSRKVDLFISDRSEAYLFEIKTSTDTTSLYTAVGQLFMHAAALQEQFNGKKIRKVLVIPGLPSLRFRQKIRQQIGIEILSYEWGENGAVIFESLSTIGL